MDNYQSQSHFYYYFVDIPLLMHITNLAIMCGLHTHRALEELPIPVSKTCVPAGTIILSHQSGNGFLKVILREKPNVLV
jgi:hypothetical protein